MLPKLTLKQKRFVDYFIETANATEAAMRVYQTVNRNTARSIGAENLAKPAIKKVIEAKILQSMPYPDLFIKGQLFNIANDGYSESSKLKALEMLAKMIGLYEEKEEKNTPVIQLCFTEPKIENFKSVIDVSVNQNC